jgi:hypothetical protein
MSRVLIGPEGPSIEQRLWAKVRYPAFAACPVCEGGQPEARFTRAEHQVVAGRIDLCERCGGSGRVLTGLTVERLITGQPDVLLGGAADELIVLDWKTTRQPPAMGDPSGAHEDDSEHVSWDGYFQQRCYGLLALVNYPEIKRVTLKEYYPLAGVARHASLTRDRLEHVERELATQAELLDRALMGGHDSALWKPTPGYACRYCPRPNQCPIEADVRVFANGTGAGGVATQAQAAKLAGEYVVAKTVYKRIAAALKPWVDAKGPIDVQDAKGRAQLRWRQNKTGGKGTFGMFVPEASDRGPADPTLEETFAGIAERRRAA